ncbi:MAG TPA: ATP-binding protein, partial [Thermoanaerobaculia bacterium]|nr:ATP-binding protein [Thermoanaerobaculia bacterium]
MKRGTAVPRVGALRRRIVGGAVLFVALALVGLVLLLRFTAAWHADLERETRALLAEQSLADRILRTVNRQLLEANRYLDQGRPELRQSFWRDGDQAYDLLRQYLFFDLSLAERLQVERVKELHQGFEVAAQSAFDGLAARDLGATDRRVEAMGRQVAALQAALDRFVGMRVEARAALGHRQAAVFNRLYGAVAPVAVAFAALLLILARFVHRRLLEPLDRISDAALRLSRGELQTRVSLAHRDELSRVAESFNEMAASLATTQADLRASETRFRGIFDGVPVGLYRVLPNGTLLDVNPALVATLGFPEAAALRAVPAGDLYADAGDRAHRQALLDTGDTVSGLEVRLRRHDGTLIWVRETVHAVRDEAGRLLCYQGAVEEVTRQRHLEEQLRQAQKMEAIGQLAGGVAHDFNNLLTAIGGYAELLLQDLDAADTRRADVQEIAKAAERATSLTRQLLAFSRKQVLKPRVLDLNAIIGETEKMLRRLIGEDIQLVTHLDDSLAKVKADPGQVQQILVNLVVNARDAMPEGGVIEIATRNLELASGSPRQASEPVQPGHYVMLAVSDSGEGMDQETLARVFEPFFTTKEQGRGTGLGLATVYGIVRQSDGYVWVYSEPGQGTTFKVYLPRAAGQESGEVEVTAGRQSIAATETVLLVEDEPMVRDLARRVLADRGYAILEAGDGEEALRVAAQHDGPIHIMLSDMVMPGMGGAELRERVLAVRPDLKVLFMSGYTADDFVRRGVMEEGFAYLDKPFTGEVLLR